MAKKLRERRRRGDGSVKPAKYDANGKPCLWRASISLGSVMINDKRRRNRPTLYAKTEAEGHVLLKQLQARHLTGDDMTPSKQTVEAFLLRWLEHVKAVNSVGTYQTYESRVRVHIIPAIGGQRLRALKTGHVQTMLDALAAKLSPSMVKDIRSILIKALNDARKWGDLLKSSPNVAADTEIRPLVEKKPLALNDAQLDRLLATIAGDPMEPLILVALGTGARISECLALLWGNVAYDDQELHILGALKRHRRPQEERGKRYELVRETFTKGRDQRTTRLSPPVAEAFRLQWQRQQQQREAAGQAWKTRGLVFTDKRGGPLDPTATSMRFKAVAKRAGLPPEFTFHSLRHSCATFLRRQGEHERTVMTILGHKSLRTTQRYGDIPSEATRDALDKYSHRLTRRGGAK